MNNETLVKPFEFFITSAESPQMTLPELGSYLKRQKNHGVGNIQAFADEYYKRFTMPLAAFIMPLSAFRFRPAKCVAEWDCTTGIKFVILFSTFSVSGML